MNRPISDILLNWFKKNGKDFPWRQNKTPYRVWISEIMLQQTTAPAVVSYFNRWMERYPDITQLAKADETEILRLWEGLGYYSRARNILKTARVLCSQSEHNSLPANKKELLKLPGIGDYTSSAILSIAFGQPEPALDANLKRLGMRLNGRIMDSRALDIWFRKQISDDRPGDFNEACMQLGQQVCRQRQPLCEKCPLSQNCKSRKLGNQAELPPPKKAQLTLLESRVLFYHRKGRLLLIKGEKGRFKDLWSAPKILWNHNDSHQEWKNVEKNACSITHLKKRTHLYTRYKETLNPVLIDANEKVSVDGGVWFTQNEWRNLPCPAVYRTILEEIEHYLAKTG